MSDTTAQRLAVVEGSVALLGTESKRQDRRMAGMWTRAMSQKDGIRDSVASRGLGDVYKRQQGMRPT